jgi:hypothetical protein
MIKRLNWFILSMLLIIASNTSWLSAQSLQKQLWTQVKSCYDNFEDIDDDGKIDAEVINDPVNGYLQVEGSWPACGCGCKNTTAAYRKSDSSYVLLSYESWNCNFIRGISSNQPFENFMPENFGLQTFYDSSINNIKTDPAI